jgi:hypothetical protein
LVEAAVGLDLGAQGVEVCEDFGVAERHAAVVDDLNMPAPSISTTVL